MVEKKNLDFLQFKDWKIKIENEIGKEEWTVCYHSKKDNVEDTLIYCGLIPNKLRKKSLENTDWELNVGDGKPGIIECYSEKRRISKYYRYSSEEGYEPLIIKRFFGNKKPYLEISEEFRLYFDLYEDRQKSKFRKIHDDGEEEDVILIQENEINIKTKFIKEYLTIKNMTFVFYFDFDRFSPYSITDLGVEEGSSEIKHDDLFYYLYISGMKGFCADEKKSLFRLHGKKLIFGYKNKKDFEAIKEKEKFAEFIIGLDEKFTEKYFTCDSEKLSNFYGKNFGNPNFLTPIYFTRDVLTKYFNQPEKYTINDGNIFYEGFWTLKIDNNHPNYVVVFLKDLAVLPYKEQLYWKSYNVYSDEGISETSWSRNFRAEWTNPEAADLVFKQKYTEFNTKWFEKYGWYFFLPLESKDIFHLKSLHVPLTNDQKEFDDQVLSLVKVLIDSINEKEISKGLILEENAKGIDKLEAFLESRNLHFDGMILFIRNLQELRSTGCAHRKGSKYVKAISNFNQEEKELSRVFERILANCIKIINSFATYFLTKD